MKKILPSLLFAAGLAAPVVSSAAPNVYGNIHMSLNQANNDVSGAANNLVISSNTSALGVKGSEDIGEGVKAIYKAEFQVNIAQPYTTFPDSGGPQETKTSEPFSSRDQFVGIKGSMGIIRIGTMSSNYKETGKEVDPLYRTPLEARGFLQTQSADLHGGRGLNRGRQTNTFSYATPKFWRQLRLVANTTFSGSNKETDGVGVRWNDKSKNWFVYVDWIEGQTGTASQCTPADNCKTEAATKGGFRYKTKSVLFGLQYESAENRTGGDYLFGSFMYNINKNNQLIVTAGQFTAKDVTTASDSMGYALAYNHKLSRLTNMYVGYGLKSADKNINTGLPNAGDESMLTAGLRKRF